MDRSIEELAGIINQKFFAKDGSRALSELRKKIMSEKTEDNEKAFKMLAEKGIILTSGEFRIIKDYTVFESRKMSKLMKSTGITYIIIGIIVLSACFILRNRLAFFGGIAALFFIFFGISTYGKAKN